MEEKVLNKYLKAGEIAKKVKEFARREVKEGIKALALVEKIEKMIKEEGGSLAFPVNICLNEVAAHYTPDINDPLTFKHGDLVKIDIGVHIDGYIADTAFTVCVGKKSHPLIDAAEETLEKLVKEFRPGKSIAELSAFIEANVKKFGFNPIRNLAGHGLDQYIQHAEPSIPNGKFDVKGTLKEDQVLGMEIFVTNGVGWVKESSPTLIYMYASEKPVRMRESRVILALARDEYNKMPFARRWLYNKISPLRITLALNELVSAGALVEYAPLKEQSKGLVAQAEETVIITKDKPIITTKI
jgi:methionyl aminopeptidase